MCKTKLIILVAYFLNVTSIISQSDDLDSICKQFLNEKNNNKTLKLKKEISGFLTTKDSSFVNVVFKIKEGVSALDNQNLEEALYVLINANKQIRKLELSDFYREQVYQSLGEIYLYKGDPINSHLFFDSTIFLYKKRKDSLGISKMLLNKVSLFLHLQNEDDSALLYLNKTQVYALNDTSIITKVLLNKGSILSNKNEIDSSVFYLFEANKIAAVKKDSANIFVSANYLSGIYYKSRDFKKSLKYGEKALLIANSLKNKRMQLSALVTYASSLQELNRQDEAIDYLLKASRISTELNDVYSKSIINQNLGTIYQMNKDFKIARQYYLDAKNDFITLNYRNSLSTCYRNLGGVEYELKNYKISKRYLLEALQIAIELNQIDIQLECYETLYLALKELKEYDKSLRYYEKYNLINDSLNEIKYSESVNRIEKEYKTKEQEQELIKQSKLIDLNKQKRNSDKKMFGVLVLFLLTLVSSLVYIILSLRKKNKKKEESFQTVSNRIIDKEFQNKELITQLELFAKEAKTKEAVIEHLKLKLNRDSNSSLLAELIKNGLKTDKDWSIFTTEFQLQYNSFCEKLYANVKKTLTKTDIKICALIKLNLTSSEIAEVLSITNSGVKKARQRVREKLIMPQNISLTKYIQNI